MEIKINFSKIPTPCYILDEKLLEKNLALLDNVQKKSGAKILLALKGFAMWNTFPTIAKVLQGIAASGLNEARLGKEEMNKEVHTYSPAFKEEEFEEILSLSDYIIFNSFNQWKRFKKKVVSYNKKIKCGIRINPEYSEVTPLIYNPCNKFSRLGVTLDQFRDDLLEGISGLHFHTLCEQNSDALERTLEVVEERFGEYIKQMEWINFGGGHHITRQDYNIDKLSSLIIDFKKRYHIEVYLEPGEAIGWQTGVLVAKILDIIHNQIDIAILDTSVEAHMPDCLAMPYRPDIEGAGKPNEYKYNYQLGGNTCLAGDIVGEYSFERPLQIGDRIIFKDMIHYTMVKNTTFNGINLPSIAMWTKDQRLKIIKNFRYEDYKGRLS
ncbi:MAG: carboxynorspermidine decarboxylase [bacterium]